MKKILFTLIAFAFSLSLYADVKVEILDKENKILFTVVNSGYCTDKYHDLLKRLEKAGKVVLESASYCNSPEANAKITILKE